MGFRVQARTILQLGAELISSDAIAFYELIKNSFDADARTVRIRIVCLLPHDVCNKFLDRIDLLETSSEDEKKLVRSLRSEISELLDGGDKMSRAAIEKLGSAETFEELRDCLRRGNRIEVQDRGAGMSIRDLKDVYLTIGTRSRYNERQNLLKRTSGNGQSTVLGEKGIGRLSVMRLGRELHVLTATSGEKRWNELAIDWNMFSHDIDQLLENVTIEPRLNGPKDTPSDSGTTITVTRLTSTWTHRRVEELVEEEFSKFIDPFAVENKYKISARFNGELVPPVPLDQLLLQVSHATLEAEYVVDGPDAPRLFGKIDYRRFGRSKSFEDKGTHLLTSSRSRSLEQLRALGPFKLRLYWFNRKFIKDSAGLDSTYIKKLVRRWAGGVMVYRDGFRVNPYGSPDDDWLGLDKRALASGGYKLNRNQLVGKLDISARHNPGLLDQTNREGLRDCDEKDVLVALLRHVILTNFKTFLDAVERELEPQEPITIDQVEQRVENTTRNLRRTWTTLLSKYPQVKKSPELVSRVEDALEELGELLDNARILVTSYEKGRDQLVHLAGVGLMVEVIGHELNRATEHTLRTLADSKKTVSTDAFENSLEALHAQLKTIQKRLRILDPLSTAGRQVKEEFDLVHWAREIVSSHENQFERHGIAAEFEVKSGNAKKTIRVNAVKGMIVQIIENLIANSVYWLSAERMSNPSFIPKLKIVVNVDSSELSVTDNGPGVEPARAEDIFRPFVTSKPPGEGKGLGLFIARELANYHGCSLAISEKKSNKGALNTFVFNFGNLTR
jgi:signal transduction histidine kinase